MRKKKRGASSRRKSPRKSKKTARQRHSKGCCKRNPLCSCHFPRAYKSPFKRFLKFICQMRRRERLRILALIRVEILKRGVSGVQVGTRTIYPFELGIQSETAALKWNEAGVQAAWFLSGQGDKKKYLACLGIYALRKYEVRVRTMKKVLRDYNIKGFASRKIRSDKGKKKRGKKK